MANRDAMVEMAVQKLGQSRSRSSSPAPNVELTWKVDADFVARAKAYGQLNVGEEADPRVAGLRQVHHDPLRS